MGVKLLWTGLTMIVALSKLGLVPGLELAGAVVMLVGLVMLWLDK